MESFCIVTKMTGLCLCSVISAAVKFGRMSKKQRDSLYAEVQKHQKSQECVSSEGGGSTALSLTRDDVVCGGGGEDGEEGLSRSYSSRGSSSTLSDLDDIAALPDLFDLPLTPEEASEYCSLELLGGGGGASAGNTSNSSSSSSSSSSLSNQNSPQQTMLDGADSNGIQLPHTHSHTHPLLGCTDALLDHLPDDCSITDLGEFWQSLTSTRTYLIDWEINQRDWMEKVNKKVVQQDRFLSLKTGAEKPIMETFFRFGVSRSLDEVNICVYLIFYGWSQQQTEMSLWIEVWGFLKEAASKYYDCWRNAGDGKYSNSCGKNMSWWAISASFCWYDQRQM